MSRPTVRVLWIALALILSALAANTVAHYLCSGPSGGGQGKSSPDGRFHANVMSLRRPDFFWRQQKWYQLEVCSGTYWGQAPYRSLRLEPGEGEPFLEACDMRLGDRVRWSPDSSRVTFLLGSVEATLDMDATSNTNSDDREQQ